MKNWFVRISAPLLRGFNGRLVAGLLGLAGVCALLAGCGNPDDVPPDRTGMLPADQRVSDVPWNKPQGWENTSQLGALANDPRINGGQQQ